MAEQRGDDVADPIDSGDAGGLGELASSGSAVHAEPEDLIRLAVAAVPTARWASLTVADTHDRLRTLACTGPDAAALDALQSQVGEGPALADVEGAEVVRHGDLSTGPWPAFAAAAAERGVRGVLAVRVPVESIGLAALTFHADRADAFSDADVEIAGICGSFLGLLLSSARERERAQNLEIALETNRQIGTAVGVLMARDLLTADVAFQRLRAASQRTHRKLRALADEVVATGQLPAAGA